MKITLADGTELEVEALVEGTEDYAAYMLLETFWRMTPHECDVLETENMMYPCTKCGCV